MKYIRLSYDLHTEDPGWPGNFTMEIEPYSQISRGDIANQSKVTLLNHFGSHMDGPRHFNDNGPRLAEMPLDTFIFERPLLLDIPKTFGELVQPEELRPYEQQIREADGLLIRSGFSRYRYSDSARYANNGPGFSANACKYLMDTFPQLKAVAMDWISLASYTHIDDGMLAHQYLLGKFHDHYICIIEDLNLEAVDPSRLERITALPLFLSQADSAPLTVIAEMRDSEAL